MSETRSVLPSKAEPLTPVANTNDRYAHSKSYHEAAKSLIAGGVNSNVRLGGGSLCFASATGSKLIDIDGNEYIDYALGMGPAILGHSPVAVTKAVAESLQTGQLFAGQHHSEAKLAELLKRYIPAADLVRIGMTGSEMVQAALRVARAYTRKAGFIKFEGQYHGWFDNVLINHSGPPSDAKQSLPFAVHLQTAGQSATSALDAHVLPWNDLGAVTSYLDSHGADIAAIITEPVMCNTGVIMPLPGYLQGLRKLCDQHKIVLIFDEVITGFRVGLGGAQGKYGIRPDISTFAKAFGGGFPVAALTGRREIMDLFSDGRVNHSGTYNAHLISVVAGIATLEQLAENDAAALTHIEKMGQSLMTGMQEMAAQYSVNLVVTGVGSVFHTQFTDHGAPIDYASYKSSDAKRQKAFIDALLPLGIRPTSRGTWFVSSAHTQEDIAKTLSAVESVFVAGF